MQHDESTSWGNVYGGIGGDGGCGALQICPANELAAVPGTQSKQALDDC